MLGIVCSDKANPKALVEALHLQSLMQKPFALYGDTKRFLVVVSGKPGMSAAATSFLYAMAGCPKHSAWLYLGHSTNLYMAHQIVGESTSFYPTFTWSLNLPTEKIKGDSACIDFYATAERFSTSECIHVLKSSGEMPAILSVIEQLEKNISVQDSQYPLSEALAPFFSHWHFSTTQQFQLKRLLQRWHAIQDEHSLWSEEVTHFKSAQNVLSYLEEKVR